MQHFQRFSDALPLRALAFEGEDACSFLQGQFTNDCLVLTEPSENGEFPVQITGYCSPKGRLLALGRLFRVLNNRFVWILPSEVAAPIQKRLQMFVLRARVQLALLDSAVSLLWQASSASGLPANNWGAVSPDGSLLMRLQDCPLLGARSLVICPSSTLESDLIPKEASPQSPLVFDASQILSGEPQIRLSTQDRFVPQMVNLDLLGGVSFTKGCYPGQEVVARSHYLGKLKRRLFGVHFTSPEEPVAAGDAIWSSADPAQPCGEIVSLSLGVNAQGHLLPDQSVALIECTLDAWKGAMAGDLLWIEGHEDRALLPSALPYEVPTEVQEPKRPKL